MLYQLLNLQNKSLFLGGFLFVLQELFSTTAWLAISTGIAIGE